MFFIVFLHRILNFFLYEVVPPPLVIHNFLYMASVEHGNEKHIKRKMCITGGGGERCSIDQKPPLIKKVYRKVNKYLFHYLK